tara:strand:+ start:155 stop:448 length:294 start_codon:yes stop_codon:yes gene_type:complete
MKTTFMHHCTESSGWVQVPIQLVFDLGIAAELSAWSRMDDTDVFLEDDFDARLFVIAFNHKFEQRPSIIKTDDPNTSIRSLKRFDAAAIAEAEGYGV